MTILGSPLRADFISFWTAARLALNGQPSAAYDVSAQWAAEQQVFPGVHFFAFFYPPLFLLLCLPLALVPYFYALLGWVLATAVAFSRTMKSVWPGHLLEVLSYPAVFLNVVYGQNGLLTAALMGVATMAMERPVVSGVCFGLLCFKPQLVLAVPFALLAMRRYRVLVTMISTSLILGVVTLALFGVGTWRAFFGSNALALATLEMSLVDKANWVSTFAAVRLFGGGVPTAYVLQSGIFLLVLALLWRSLDRRHPGGEMSLPVAAVLVSPFVMAYDLAMVALPIFWILQEGCRRGFLPWEKVVVGLAFILPIMSPLTIHYLGLPVAPPVLFALFLVVLRRSSSSCEKMDHPVAGRPPRPMDIDR